MDFVKSEEHYGAKAPEQARICKLRPIAPHYRTLNFNPLSSDTPPQVVRKREMVRKNYRRDEATSSIEPVGELTRVRSASARHVRTNTVTAKATVSRNSGQMRLLITTEGRRPVAVKIQDIFATIAHGRGNRVQSRANSRASKPSPPAAARREGMKNDATARMDSRWQPRTVPNAGAVIFRHRTPSQLHRTFLPIFKG